MRTVGPPFGPVFLRVAFATFLHSLASAMLRPVLPQYVEGRLGGHATAVGLVVGAFSMAAVLVRPASGRIGDRRGRPVLMVWGGAVDAAATAALAWTPSVAPIVALRTLAGLGGACFFVGAASVVNDLAPEDRRGEAMSYFSLALYMGMALGPVAGEAVLGRAGFVGVWWGGAVVALAAAAPAIRLPDTRPSAPAVAARRGSFLHPASVLPGLVMVSCVWGFAAFNAFLPLHALEAGFGGSGGLFAAYSAVALVMRSVGARIPDGLGPPRTALLAVLGSVAGLVVLAASGGGVPVVAGTMLFSAGQSLVFPGLMTIAVQRARPDERGDAVGSFTAFFDVAFGVGALTAGAVAGAVGYRGMFLAGAVVATCGLVPLVRTVAVPQLVKEDAS